MFLNKLFFFLLALSSITNTLMAQKNEDYSPYWKKVAAYEKQGLTKSALKEVINIYRMALKDNNNAQQIKSAIYQVRYRNMVEEDSQEKNIAFVDSLIATSKPPSKNILQSMQAEMYWRYLQNNRYKLYNRTKLLEENSKDIGTWSAARLHSTITGLYRSSLLDTKLLMSTSLGSFDPVIVQGQNTRHLRPTLFDFLGNRALEYFSNDERDLIQPAYHFTVSDAKAFSPAPEFVKASFESADTGSLHYQAILLLQQLLQFHLNDKSNDALLDADLARLNFIFQYSVNEQKEKLYEDALKKIETSYTGNAGITQAMYLRARLYFDRGQDYDPLTRTLNQFEIKRARELCAEAIKVFPRSEGAINCQNLLAQILQPSLGLETEKVNTPGQPFRSRLSYKNAPIVYFRVISTTREAMKKMDRGNYEKLWQQLVDMKPLREWNLTLPDPKDHQVHATEIKVDGLPIGTYLVLASLNAQFSLRDNFMAKQLIYTSNISYVHNSDNDFYVLHRETGEPLPDINVQVWQTKYNYNTSRNEETRAENYTSDKNGYFKVKQLSEYRNFLLQLRGKNDELFTDENNYNNVYNGIVQETKPVSILFTDRSIYRPGQTVYFKGIVLKKAEKPSETAIIEHFSSVLILKDANGQKLAQLNMVTNAYGSYNGSFKLPEGILNGQFSIFDETTNSTKDFQVEEYKRPKFFVEVSKPSGTYRLFDSVMVVGKAAAYAGNAIDGATVNYRVVRKVRFQPWWLGIYGGYGAKIMPPGRPTDEMEITNGRLVTDVNGGFRINFLAIPDETVSKTEQPIFYYEVSAEITDRNGETRRGETSIAVAYQALQIHIDAGDRINADSAKNLKIRTVNTNELFEKAKINVTVSRLQSPGRVLRKRYWERPDQFVMGKAEFESYFPYDIYKDEDQQIQWPVAEKVSDKTDSTQDDGRWGIPANQLTTGWYKITATARDKYGEEVTALKIIWIETAEGGASTENPVDIYRPDEEVAPGQSFSYRVSTAFDKIYLIKTISRIDKTNRTSYHQVSNRQPYQDKIAVNEEDRGGISMSYLFVRNNRVYKGVEDFSVPWVNKELNISYETFRDKLLPGAQEKWTAKITGSKGEKIAAEVLVSMYDASLDQFEPQNWDKPAIWPVLINPIKWVENGFTAILSEGYNKIKFEYQSPAPKSYDQLIPFFTYRNQRYFTKGLDRVQYKLKPGFAPEQMQEMALAEDVSSSLVVNGMLADSSVIEAANRNNGEPVAPGNLGAGEGQPQIRKNFNETAFFFPELATDEAGNVSFSFTIPEAMTQWKLMTLAHSTQLASGYLEKLVVTQKPLMVQPNAPRFFREGDRMEFSAKIVNLSDTELTGTAQLELLDAATNKPVDGWFKNVFPNQYFTVASGQSSVVRFPIEVPFQFNTALAYRITAKSKAGEGNSFSDGEEMALPVLTNRLLVTETLPLNLRGANSKSYKWDKLLNSERSGSLSNHALTVEYSTNPAWYAVQALPYLSEYPYDCAEQIFNRYYANVLAGHISNSMPRIKSVFEQWKTIDTAALLSNLQKNSELKSALLEETPWVLDAVNENEQKKHIALLFDITRMSAETSKAIKQLRETQSPNGGFVWFKGAPDDRYITQYIISGIGHLRKLNALSSMENDQIKPLVDKAIPYLDRKIKEDYDWLIKQKTVLADENLGYLAAHYLYMRSFFKDYPMPAASQKAYEYFYGQAKKFWLKNGKYMQAMIALTLHRNNDEPAAKSIIRSLKENSIDSEELGMYWKEWTSPGWYWYQAPIESQALMVEAFTDIDKDIPTIDALKAWLIKQKQTQNWSTTKATAEACYAILLSGSNWLNEEKQVTIRLGNTTISSKENSSEAGTGYFKKTIAGKEIEPRMGNIAVTIEPPAPGKKESSGSSMGAVYWQYFEDLDKITAATTPLKLTKKLFVEKNTDKGPVLEAIHENGILKVGDKLKVRIELKVDREMEYLHMKDMRAACMEPVNVISEYKYQGGMGYYESTKDASTNFFFNRLGRGTYVFEYQLFVTHQGNFSNGITTIQCMYAPEFTSHSEGLRVNVE